MVWTHEGRHGPPISAIPDPRAGLAAYWVGTHLPGGVERRAGAAVYAQRGTRLRAAGQCRHLTEARAELDWLASLPAQSAQQVLAHLDRAYDNWRHPDHPAGPPRFKKRRNELSVPFPGQAVAVRKLSNR